MQIQFIVLLYPEKEWPCSIMRGAVSLLSPLHQGLHPPPPGECLPSAESFTELCCISSDSFTPELINVSAFTRSARSPSPCAPVHERTHGTLGRHHQRLSSPASVDASSLVIKRMLLCAFYHRHKAAWVLVKDILTGNITRIEEAVVTSKLIYTLMTSETNEDIARKLLIKT